MTQPTSRIDTFTSAGQGEQFLTKTNTEFGLFAEVTGPVTLGNVTLDVTLEVSPDGDAWAPLDSSFNLTEADLVEQSTGPLSATAYASDHNQPVELVRVNVRTLDPADAELETNVFIAGGGPRGVQYNRSLDV